jgi:hypothetical protein
MILPMPSCNRKDRKFKIVSFFPCTWHLAILPPFEINIFNVLKMNFFFFLFLILWPPLNKVSIRVLILGYDRVQI